MKILAGNIKQVADSLGAIVNAIPLEISSAYKLMRIAKKVALAQEAFEKRRVIALNEHGKKDKDGNLITADGKPNGAVVFKGKGQEEFAKAFSILVNEDVELDFDPIPLELLTKRSSGNPYKDKDGEPVTILPSILLGLEPILVAEGDEKNS